ncbi:hypothetical protein CALCODRAFT_482670 [Calocera cornea HHB12733]|uniref:F-box domain-containing protein n=1 Tax=Calocera cornea HHB12733 TaxID=1353952 RepID=A0A165GEF3_9BASI|nr:hypothetical protein CALCODRAFT_482670 [Calocera cornea HHB12733]
MSPEPVEIPWTVFKPLISCGSLDSLFLSFAYHICVTDEDLEDLARALPNLRKLAFCGKLVRRAYYPERHSHVQPDVTTYGLLALVQHCPELRSITLPLSMGFGPPSADDTQFNQRPRPIFKQLKKPLKWFKSIRAVKQANRPDTSSNAGAEATAIEADDNEELCYPVAAHVSDLEVSYSPDPGNAQQTATFLRQVFPHLERLHHEVMWSQDPPRDEYSAREEQRKKRWAEVKQVLGLEKGGITVYNMNWLPLSWE